MCALTLAKLRIYIYIIYIYMYVLYVCIYDVYNVSVKLRSGYDM